MEKFVPMVIDRAICKRHGALMGAPCWWIQSIPTGFDRSMPYPAICSDRAKRAGFNGKITSDSLLRKGKFRNSKPNKPSSN